MMLTSRSLIFALSFILYGFWPLVIAIETTSLPAPPKPVPTGGEFCPQKVCVAPGSGGRMDPQCPDRCKDDCTFIADPCCPQQRAPVCNDAISSSSISSATASGANTSPTAESSSAVSTVSSFVSSSASTVTPASTSVTSTTPSSEPTSPKSAGSPIESNLSIIALACILVLAADYCS
ncbi:uncharacterized protein BYT42DRAFT_586344 [Radiomyces spectabilis]|uniref:uncharacterized protein n=1 Tax=Radiomyces spectabilis TaxID=64574 RepID=UPI00221FC5A4|nr:uncharacterized protein BYT42DRAFT_586344 [Radiomyces spectabilis]KAI8367466.1 hypothetical protein BYT42DRAFT_586344 [Radiomyces spectabilis]